MIDNPTIQTSPTDAANTLFRITTNRGHAYRFLSFLTGHDQHLLDLERKLCCQQVQGSHYSGLHTVNINQIRGTQGKADAFDEKFHPTREAIRSRWLSVAREKLNGHELPPVELVELEGIFYVRDGHHRISVARSLGQVYIDAEVTVVNLDCASC